MYSIDISSAVFGYARPAASGCPLTVTPRRSWFIEAGVCPAPIESQPGGRRTAASAGNGVSALRVERAQMHLSTRQFKHNQGFPDLRPPV